MSLLIYATAAAIGLITLAAFFRTRNPLHPALVLAPVFAMAYVADPLTLIRSDLLHVYFPNRENTELILWINLACVTAFFSGTVVLIRREHINWDWRRFTESLDLLVATDHDRHRVRQIALFLAVIASATFWYGIYRSGGFVEVYNQVKGGAQAASGYLGEAPLLALPAAILFALANNWKPVTVGGIFGLILILSPHLIQGTFGGRRGPLFLGLCTLFLAWIVYRRSPPGVLLTTITLAAILLSVVFVMSQRQHLYIGSKQGVKIEEFTKVLLNDEGEVDTGNNYIFSGGLILTSKLANRNYWGKRGFVTLFIRPIPRQIWPTKYEDVGAYWATKDAKPGYAGFEAIEWYRATGWRPPSGSAAGLVADLFLEFRFGCVAACFFAGLGIGWLWKKMVENGGLWLLLYLELLMFSIYLPTQGFFTAFLYRFILVGIITCLVWRYLVNGRQSTSPFQPANNWQNQY